MDGQGVGKVWFLGSYGSGRNGGRGVWSYPVKWTSAICLSLLSPTMFAHPWERSKYYYGWLSIFEVIVKQAIPSFRCTLRSISTYLVGRLSWVMKKRGRLCSWEMTGENIDGRGGSAPQRAAAFWGLLAVRSFPTRSLWTPWENALTETSLSSSCDV